MIDSIHGLRGDLLELRVTMIRDEAEAIRSFELRDPTDGELPPYGAGAHVEVMLDIPDGGVTPRHYSLLGDPEDRTRYRIAVLLEGEGRGGSRFMHERVGVGSMLRVTPPENGFPLVTSAQHSILIAGGIGITPLMGMVHTLAREGGSFELHYAARSPDRMAFREELGVLGGERVHFYHTHVNVPQMPDLEKLLAGPAPGVHAYVCGPAGLIRAVTTIAESAGWPAQQVHFESFGAKQLAGDRPITVYLERSDITLTVPPGETILDAVLNAGVWATYECRRGTCASCLTRVVAGVPEHRDVCLSPALQADHMCLCVSRARSDHLTLDL